MTPDMENEMPQILELKGIDGELWARIGKPTDFPSGVALWTPEEQTRVKQLAIRDVNAELLFACRAFVEQYDKLAGFPHAREPYVGALIVARAAIANAAT